MDNKNFFEDDEIVTLTGADGKDIEFVEIADIELDGTLYSILEPVELPEGEEEAIPLVFKVTPTSNDEATYEIVLDDAIVEKVFNEYDRLIEEAEEEK